VPVSILSGPGRSRPWRISQVLQPVLKEPISLSIIPEPEPPPSVRSGS